MEELFLPAIELHGVNEVRQRKIHTAEPLVLELGAFEVELDIEKLKSHKSRGIDQIPVALIKTVVEKFVEIHKIIISISNKEELPLECKSRSLNLFIRRAIKQSLAVIETYQFCQLRTKFYPTSSS